MCAYHVASFNNTPNARPILKQTQNSSSLNNPKHHTVSHLQLRPHSLQPILDILQCLRRRLPLVKLLQKLGRLRIQLGAHKVLFEQAAHDPREVIGVRVVRRALVDLTGDITHVSGFEGVRYREAGELSVTRRVTRRNGTYS